MTYPSQSKSVHVEQIDGELCVYDWRRKEVHALNPTAALVWQLCDGRSSPAQIAAQVHARLGASHAEDLVALSLEQLQAAHLLDGGPLQRATVTRRQLLKTLGVSAALLPAIRSIVAPAPIAAQSAVPTATSTSTVGPTATSTSTVGPTATSTSTPTLVPTGSQTFNYTGAPQAFTVPAGVTSVTILALGAAGGNSGLFQEDPGGAGGLGGSVQGVFTVTPESTIEIYVGGAGVNGDDQTVGDAFGGAGGTSTFIGGTGGTGGTGGSGGGGGGGASIVVIGAEVLVAGGGGGGGGGSDFAASASGGAGGGPAGSGENGANAPTAAITTTDASIPSGGATPAAGGAGGVSGANGSSAGGAGGNEIGTPGTAGTAGGTNGGTGGTGGTAQGGGGGGGGGGFDSGGGGGGGSAFSLGSTTSGAGGGGGASFASPGAASVSHQRGVRTGNGQVVISW